MDGTADVVRTEEYDLLIGDERRPAASGETAPVVNPATEESIAEVAMATAADVDRAVETAGSAAEAWASRPGEERGRILNRVASALRDDADRLAELLTLENGKPLQRAKSDVLIGARYFEYYAGYADKIHGESIPLSPEYTDYTIEEPLGVTGHITPWNVPVNLVGRTVAPALAAGNAAVLKPPEETPLSPLEVGELALEAGVPPGVLNVVPGEGEEAGAALAGHPDVGGVSFTGSVVAGKSVAKRAVENFTHVHVEAGGKNSAIVFPDADVESALESVELGIFTMNAGQVCSAADRLLVHEDVRDEVVDRLAERTRELTVGPGMDDHDLGAIVSADQYDRVAEYVETGRAEVGEPLVGGDLEDGPGYFVPPTVFVDVDPDATVAQEEIFGPVLVVSTFSEEAEAVALANDVEYGLVAGVFTSDLGRAHRLARDLDAGQVYVNEWFAGGVQTPFGGYKMSGFGREKGLDAIEEFTQTKNVGVRIED